MGYNRRNLMSDLYDSLVRWNIWGVWELQEGHKRAIVDEICQYFATEEVIALVGSRRAGKSTILYQIISRLLLEGIEAKAILHINFEEPGFSPYLTPQLLDQLYDLYRSKIYPKGKAYIFLDEVQNVPEWERWVRARNDTEDIKIFITGSSSALLSGELATVLTGRNFCFEIYPLSFIEILEFNDISCPNRPFPTAPPPEIQYALNGYLQWGGFPRVVLAKADHERERLLKQYFDEILFKDIVQRHKIRDIIALRNIAVHVLTNTSTLVSYKRLADIFQVSQDLAQSYITYLEEAFIIHSLSFYSLKASERTRNPFKVHALDLGLRKVASLSASMDETKLIETQVHNTLLRKKTDGIFYWKGEGEIDFLIQSGVAVSQLIQVAYAGLNRPEVAARELGGLQKAIKKFPMAKASVITWELGEVFNREQYPEIEIVPLWHFLLS